MRRTPIFLRFILTQQFATLTSRITALFYREKIDGEREAGVLMTQALSHYRRLE